MKKILSTQLTLYFYQKYFPFKRNKQKKKNKVLLSIGGNIGNTKMRFKKLFQYFEKDKRFYIIKTSPILKNPPFGFIKQNYFYNSLIELETCLKPQKLLKIILAIEKLFKRVRKFKNGPRTLDIDIIFYGTITLKNQHLILPHSKWFERESILIPLYYLGKN
jgi:2-amino-4-hydroxy-6-hydroxymethyldihydropteridine diphosphokinase